MAKTKEPENQAPEAGAERAGKVEAGSHLVAMQKDGETIAVHPSCTAAHRALGWVEA